MNGHENLGDIVKAVFDVTKCFDLAYDIGLLPTSPPSAMIARTCII